MSVLLDSQPDAALMVAAMQKERVDFALLLEMKFASGTVYISDGNTTFTDTAAGHTWQGFGELVGMSEISASSGDLSPYREYYLGIPWGMLSADDKALSGMGRIPELIGNKPDFMGLEANLYMQIFDDETLTAGGQPSPVGTPFALSPGLMDSVKAQYNREGAVLAMTVEGLLSRQGAPLYGLMTDRDQRNRYSTDKGLSYVIEVMAKDVKWTDF